MLTMSCVCFCNVQGEPSRQLDAAIRDMVMRELALQLAHLNSSQGLAAFGLPTPVAQPASAVVVNESARYDAATQAAVRDERVPQLNPEQRAVYDNVMAAVNHSAFFVDGLGGTSKTFLYSCLQSTVCVEGRVAIAMASSGIAVCCWTKAALHTHVSRSLCKASIARPHATSVGTLSWQHFCKRLRSLCGMRLS
jgi:hypothetical protein